MQFLARPARRLLLLRRTHVLLAFPVSAGIGLFLLSPAPTPALAALSSAELIPCSPRPALAPTIFSPSEVDRTIAAAVQRFLRDNLWEPILTAKRFVYLLFLFAPVFLASPMLLIGRPQRALKGDKWGAVWWYGLLVSRMQAAGPTFIKV
jgi:aarF domain-containing kinase